MSHFQPSPRILIVDADAEASRQMTCALRAAGHSDVTCASTVEMAESTLQSEGPFALVLLDVRLSDQSGLALLQKLAPKAPHTIVIATVAEQGFLTAIECQKRGAYDCVLKPIDSDSVTLSVGVALKRRQHELADLQKQRLLEELAEERLTDLVKSRGALIGAVCRLAEFCTPHPHVHPERVARYSRAIADELAGRSPYAPFISQDFLGNISEAALLHDIGKLAMPDSILLKPDDLTPEEDALLQTHTTVGRDICLAALGQLDPPGDGFIHMAAEVTGSHHERWDGTGFPERLKGTQIPLSARIVSVADYYDAWRMPMVYRADWLAPEEVAEMIFDQSASRFDPVVVEAFKRSRPAIAQTEQDLPSDFSLVPPDPDATRRDTTLVS